MDEDLAVSEELIIPAEELRWRFGTSGGPGGQHANRSSTRVQLSFDIDASAVVDDALRARISGRLGRRIRRGLVTVTVDESRSQWRNRQIARQRLAELLRRAMLRPPTRHPTRPPESAVRKRLDSKRRRSEIKRLRQRPEPE